jgi:C4-dicarboxylate-specific signal transduction histidine kinase
VSKKPNSSSPSLESWTQAILEHVAAIQDGKNTLTQEDIDDAQSDNTKQLLKIIFLLQQRTSSKTALEAMEAEANRAMQLENAYAALDESHQALRTIQSQLIQAGRLAAVGELGAGIAHELNQPLTTIQGFAQRIINKPERPIKDFVDELELIIRGADRMSKIVNNIRRFARQDTYSPKPLDLFAPCKEALSLMAEQLRLLGIRVEIPESVYLPLVAGDFVQLEQVFLNLLGNARDALLCTDANHQKCIKIQPDVSATSAIIRVIDNGPGLKPGDSSKIFDPFYTTKPQGEGTGLGLSIAHGILQTHSGRISYTPVLGGGCEFAVHVPVASLDVAGADEDND